MRIARVGRAEGDVLLLVAGLARAGGVAALARRRVCPGLHGMAPEPVVAVDEAPVWPVDELRLHLDHFCPRVAVEAEVLVVAGGARLDVAARDRGVASQEIALVRHLGDRPQGIPGQILVAGVAARGGGLLPLFVALPAGPVGRAGRVPAPRV